MIPLSLLGVAANSDSSELNGSVINDECDLENLKDRKVFVKVALNPASDRSLNYL